MAIAIFCNEVKGKSMLALGRDLDVQYKTAFVLAHKLREAMASATKALRIGGKGRVAEVDGVYFGSHVRPENLATERVDRRLAEHRGRLTDRCGNRGGDRANRDSKTNVRRSRRSATHPSAARDAAPTV
jgi:hypothetical protein